VIAKPEVDDTAFLWRLNANIETKFAIGKNQDIIHRSTLSDFMLQENLFDKLKKDFEIVKLNDGKGGLVSNYIIDEFPSPLNEPAEKH
jgi:hypothetical protein